MDGLTPGAYYFDAPSCTLVHLKRGDFRDRATYLALGQDLAGDAAASVGATGITFFDVDVTEFFSPHAANKSAIFLVAIGNPVTIDSKLPPKKT